MSGQRRRRYRVRYRGRTSTPDWTFTEAMKMARAIPIAHSIEILDEKRRVILTIPARKPDDDDKNAGY